MNTDQIISWVAINLSVISLIVSVYRIYRDRSKLFTFCEIIYDATTDPVNPPPVLRIYAINKGIRPVTITEFGLHVTRKSASMSLLKPESLKESDEGYVVGFPENLSQNVGIKMEDGDIYEIKVRHDDYDRLYDCNYDAKKVKKYFIRDVLGRKYFVKGSKSAIKTLLKYKA